MTSLRRQRRAGKERHGGRAGRGGSFASAHAQEGQARKGCEGAREVGSCRLAHSGLVSTGFQRSRQRLLVLPGSELLLCCGFVISDDQGQGVNVPSRAIMAPLLLSSKKPLTPGMPRVGALR